MKTFKQFLREATAAGPAKRIKSATGVNGSGVTTVTYEDGTTADLTGPRPIRNNNPGNLEASPGFSQKQPGYVGSDGRYAVFATKQDGWNAKINLLRTQTYQQLSIRDAFIRYAPPRENPNYIRDLQSYTGFDLNRKMSSLSSSEFQTLVNAVAKIEGAGDFANKFPIASAPGQSAEHTGEGGAGSPNEETGEQKQDFGSMSGAWSAITNAVNLIRNYGKTF